MSIVDGGALFGFALGYLALLAVPGPNMLALASVAALRGWRAALPLCAGLAAGALLLAATIALSFRFASAGLNGLPLLHP